MLLNARHLGAASACMTVFLTTCTCAPPALDDAGHDAGRGWLDSGSRDAARPDATRDVGRDAPSDASPDGGPYDPEWVMLEGQPEGVELYVARHPERVLHVDWESCGSGCLRAICPGTCGWLGAYVDGASRIGWIQTPENLQTAILVDVQTGTPVAAWKLWDVEVPIGQSGAPAFGGNRIAISAWANRVGGPTQLSAWTAARDRVSVDLVPVYQQDVTSSLTITGNLVTATHRAWLFSPTGTIVLTDDRDTRAVFPPRGVTGSLASPHLVDDRVFYELWADHIRVWSGTIEEAPSVLIDATPGEVRYFRTDGRVMAWLQGYDYDWDTLQFARLELWTAPFATRASDVLPRRVLGSFRGLIPTTVGGHWLAVQGEGPTMDVFDLTDGSRRNWTPPDGGDVLDPPLFATDDEILVTTNVGTFRIDPNTLPIIDAGSP